MIRPNFNRGETEDSEQGDPPFVEENGQNRPSRHNTEVLDHINKQKPEVVVFHLVYSPFSVVAHQLIRNLTIPTGSAVTLAIT